MDSHATSAHADRAELFALVTRAHAGDLAAQSDLVRRYSRRIAGFVRTIVRRADAVDDVVQLVFIKMIRRLPRLRDAQLFESWLFTLSRNTAVDALRRVRRCPVASAEDESLVAHAHDPANPQAMSEIMEALQLALEKVTPKDRAIVMLAVEGHSYDEIAARERLTPLAVKARLARVRRHLRAVVSDATDRQAKRAKKLRVVRARSFPPAPACALAA